MFQFLWQKNKHFLQMLCIKNNFSGYNKHPGTRQWILLSLFAYTLVLSGCSTVQFAADKVGGMALNALGISVPEKPDVPLPPRVVSVQLNAAQDLNAGDDGKGLSVIFRLYKLKNQNAFLSAPYSTFGNAEKEKEAMGDDLVEARELTISPGQVIKLKELVPREAGYIGMVTLFRSPSPQRWRFAFVSADASSSGLTIGLHHCAMTATSTAPIGISLSESMLLSPTQCQ